MPSPSLKEVCAKFATLVESKAGSDSHAPQLELLHEIFELLKTVPSDDVKAATPALEKGLTMSIQQVRAGLPARTRVPGVHANYL